jgi:hypothetical protein
MSTVKLAFYLFTYIEWIMVGRLGNIGHSHLSMFLGHLSLFIDVKPKNPKLLYLIW